MGYWQSIKLMVPAIFYGSALVSAYVALPPSADPFFQPPTGWESTTPGTILRYREVPKPAAINTAVAHSWNILLRSTDSNGIASAVTMSVFVPPNANFSRVLSVEEPYDSAAIDCSPTYAINQANDSNVYPFLAQMLNAGIVIAYPDYEGFTAAFTNGIQAGQAVLDSTRAVLNSNKFTGVSPQAQVILTGASGGSLAAEWALELQPKYAPSLHIAGSILTATVPNVTSVIQTVDGTYASGLIPASLFGLAKQFLSLGAWLNYNINPKNADKLLGATEKCPGQFDVTFLFQHIQDYLLPNATLLTDPTVLSVINAVGIQGQHGVPASPVFIYKGTKDEISPIADTDALVTSLCGKNATIDYQRAVGADHRTAGYAGFAVAIPWMNDRFNGVPISGCQTNNVTVPAGDNPPLGLTSIFGLPSPQQSK